MIYYFKSMLKYWKTTIKIIIKSILPRSEMSEITVDDLFDRINSNLPPLLIDIRSAQEFNEGYGHIPNAKSIPFMEFSPNSEDLQPFKEKEIVTICPGGGLSLIAVDILVDADFKDVKSLKGGMDLWHKNGYPLTTE